MAIILYLFYSTSVLDKVVGVVVILLGIPIYLYYSKRTNVRGLRGGLESEESVLVRNLEKQNRFLASLIRLVKEALRKARGRGTSYGKPDRRQAYH